MSFRVLFSDNNKKKKECKTSLFDNVCQCFVWIFVFRAGGQFLPHLEILNQSFLQLFQIKGNKNGKLNGKFNNNKKKFYFLSLFSHPLWNRILKIMKIENKKELTKEKKNKVNFYSLKFIKSILIRRGIKCY